MPLPSVDWLTLAVRLGALALGIGFWIGLAMITAATL